MTNSTNNTDSPVDINSSEITTDISDAQKLVKTETFENLKKEVLQLKDDFNDEKKEIIHLRGEFEKSRFDLITLLGVFVGLITYLGLEVQVFKTINNPLLIIGISLFFIASILLFILSINVIIKKTDSLIWKDFNHPLYLILVVLFIFSIFFIITGYKDYSQKDCFHIQFLNTYDK